MSEVCVVGAGVIGLAVAASLRDRGVDVVCLERAQVGDGQSAGRTRQFRHLHREPHLIELAMRAREGWLRWQRRFGRTLLGSEGALRVGAAPCELGSLRAAGVPALALDARRTTDLFPIARPPEGTVLWDPLAGAIRAADTVAALADHIGPSLRRAEVESILIGAGADSVEVRTSVGVHRSHRCVVCAGAGTDRLVRQLGLRVHQYRQAHLRLAFRVKAAPSGPLPCYSDRSGAADEFIYGLTDLDGRYAVGLATVTTYPAVEDMALDVPRGIDLAPQRERIVKYVRAALPGLEPRPIDQVMRLTTTLPDHPEDGYDVFREGPVLAIAGPNLFKFAPVIGEQLAEMAVEQS